MRVTRGSSSSAAGPSTSRAVAAFGIKELGKKWWIVYADYAFGKQNTAVFTAAAPKLGGTLLGSTPYPLGKPEFSAPTPSRS